MTRTALLPHLTAVGLFALFIPFGHGQDEAEEQQMSREEFLAQFDWQQGGDADLGKVAVIDLGNDYEALDGSDSLSLLQAFGNLIEDEPSGLVKPLDADWFVVFEYDKSGYVADDEKDELDADAMLKKMRDNEKLVNKELKEYGMPTQTTTGWAKEPFYNPDTNNLEWAIRFRTEGDEEETVNYRTKLLGRKGVMDVVLVCDPSELDGVLPRYQSLLLGFDYNSGQKYAEYKDGDKLAEYGLTALVVGGAAAVGAKLGLFAWLAVAFKKFGKFIILGVVAIGVFLKKIFVGNKGE